jgi:hypothetical protein
LQIIPSAHDHQITLDVNIVIQSGFQSGTHSFPLFGLDKFRKYPLVIKYGWLENRPFMLKKRHLLHSIYKGFPAMLMFDDTEMMSGSS